MMRGLVYLVYVVVWLLVIRMVLRAVARLFGAGAAAGPAGPAAPRRRVGPAEDLVRDRICNTHVPRSRALKAVVDGREEHFCSAACRDRARAAVARAS